ncbi:MAG: DUF4325 domain-containing protein [Magnetococcales bacterium]|nr:DUF4325 domain-containing protein [Magnetococcales bacterium]
MPAIHEGKVIVFDFADVESAPHSFLNALLAEGYGCWGSGLQTHQVPQHHHQHSRDHRLDFR